MERFWFLWSLAQVLVDEGREHLRARRPAQGTVEFGAAVLGVAAAAAAFWLLFGPAIEALGQRLVGQVNGIK